MRILLAEDDPNIVIIAKMALEKLGGHAVTHASDGIKALEFATNNTYDLILLDGMMPGKDGLRVCIELKQNYQVITPIIFLSAKSQEADIRQGLSAGAIGYIQKPFDPKSLNDQIKSLLATLGQEAA